MSQYAAERRESVVRRLLQPEGVSIAELARETGVSTWTLYHWRKQAIEQGEVAVGWMKRSGIQESKAPDYGAARLHPGYIELARLFSRYHKLI